MQVNDFIVFTDLISLPELLLALENGYKHRARIEDLLVCSGNLAMPSMSRFQLLKNFSKVGIPIIEGDDSFMWKIFACKLVGFSGLRFEDEDCIITFENSVDENFVEPLLSRTFEEDVVVNTKKSGFFKGLKKKTTPVKKSAHLKRDYGFEEACQALSRIQQFSKQRLLEMIDVEIREKEYHAALELSIDALTMYKPVLQPSLVRFNEEMYQEITRDANLSVE